MLGQSSHRRRAAQRLVSVWGKVFRSRGTQPGRGGKAGDLCLRQTAGKVGGEDPEGAKDEVPSVKAWRRCPKYKPMTQN